MENIKGYTIRPGRIRQNGEVLFTDGTNEVMANQVTCEAYGYTYNIATGTCNAYRYNTNLERNISNINNKFNGAGNRTELGTNTVQINGSNNTTKGFNNNCLINGSDNEIGNGANNSLIAGSNNEISTGINNATAIGSNGVARIDCEFLRSSSDGVGQYSTFFLSGKSVSNTDTQLKLNGVTGATIIPRLADTLYSYTIDLVSYRTGGSSGSGAVGDRGFFRIEGFTVGSNEVETYTTVVSKGVMTGISFGTSYSGPDMSITVIGGVNTNEEEKDSSVC
jgi:hypothetical protein